MKHARLSRWFRLIVLLPIALFLIYDLVIDAFVLHQFASAHFAIESVTFLFVLIIFVIDLRELRELRSRLDHEETRNKVLAGEIAEGIDAQMDGWKLTRTEREVAWLIVKGYRFSEIADLRHVKESTTRLQASTIYSKAGVRGRAEFVAEIVQQLLTPILDEDYRLHGRNNV
ncbi:MAG: helix-turn-helix transcriptional regulator [Alphaproteobacteria bacterium]|nr:helix-turn-helix transcriptional regulator [Alphaproteobacteria bacterium]